MASWEEVLREINAQAASNPDINPVDTVRRKYVKMICDKIGRNVICYYLTLRWEE